MTSAPPLLPLGHSPGMSSPEQSDRLAALSQQILAAIETSAISHGVDLPAKRITTAGESVHDCPQVAVTAVSIQTGMPDATNTTGAFSAVGCQPVWSVTYTIEVVLEAPLWPENDEGVVGAAPINTWHTDTVSPITGVLLDAIDTLPSFGEKSFTLRYPAPSGGFAVVSGNLVIALP